MSVTASNDFQEQIFSACTWFDNPLCQKLQDKQFEMAVLLAVNGGLLGSNLITKKEAQVIVKRVIELLEKTLEE